jgi:outer membrane protein assembly factor BamB
MWRQASDGKLIFSVFVDDQKLTVVAQDWNGNVVWQASPGTFFSKHGFAASPVLCPDGLIVNGHQDGDAFVVLLNPETGMERWRYKPDASLRSFSTPLVVDVEGQTQIVLAGAKQTLALDPKTGLRLWYVDGPTEKVVCSPSVGLGHVFSFGGSPEARAIAIKQGGQGNVTDTHIVWTKERGMPYVPTPLLYGDLLHVIDDTGIYTCIEPISGKVLTTKRKGGNTYSSPIGAADRVYMFDDTGMCLVIANNSKYEVLAKNDLGELVQTTPAFADGALYVRSESHLWRIE